MTPPAAPEPPISRASRFAGRWFVPLTVTVLLLTGALQIYTSTLETISVDEALHLAAGYVYLTHGDFNFNAEHPPLSKVWSALPLLALGPAIDYTPQMQADDYTTGDRFLFSNRVPADTLLLAGRVPMVLISLGVGLAVALWTRRRAGALAGLIALGFFALDPNFIAHGRYITNDVIASLFFFLSCLAWTRYWQHSSGRNLVWTGALSGLALMSKFTMLMILPLFALYALLSPSPSLTLAAKLRRLAVSYAGVFSIAGLVVFASYAFQTATLSSDIRFARYFDPATREKAIATVPPSLQPLLDPATRAGALLQWAATRVPLPAYSFFKGVYRQWNHNHWGHEAYLFGQVSQKGWWYYFPIAFALKTPLATWAALILALGLALAFRRRLSVPWLVLLLPPLFYLLFSMRGNINIGHRYLLPMYPFLFAFLGIVLARSRRTCLAAAVLLGVLSLETYAIHPHYLAFFNPFAGGSVHAKTYLVDSNIDWGQDILKLRQYLNRHGIGSVCMAYFGSANLDYYGIRRTSLYAVRPGDTCTAAVSATYLMSRDSLAWLRPCTPDATIGYSIYIYSVAPGRCQPPPDRFPQARSATPFGDPLRSPLSLPDSRKPPGAASGAPGR